MKGSATRRLSPAAVAPGLLLALLAAALAGPARAYDPPASVRAAVDEASGPNGFSGVVLIDAGDGRPWVHAAGQASLDPARAVTPDTAFDIGSVGKILTAVAMMQLVEAGRVSLDAPVTDYLPDFPSEPGRRITVAMLLDHTAGLDDVLFNPTFRAPMAAARNNHDVYAVIAAQPHRGAPGAGFAYSNSGLIVAGEVIARVSGQTYEAYLKTHVLDPAGMTGAAFSGQAAAVRAFGYVNGERPGPGGPGPRLDPSRAQPLSPTPYDQPTPFADAQIATAAGGLYARAADLAAFGRALIDNRLISADSLTRMCAPRHGGGGPMSSGLSCATISGGGVVTLGHNGGRPGMEAEFAVAPAKGAVLVVLSNHDRRATALAMRLRPALAALPDG